jgi:hypothetical protein
VNGLVNQLDYKDLKGTLDLKVFRVYKVLLVPRDQLELKEIQVLKDRQELMVLMVMMEHEVQLVLLDLKVQPEQLEPQVAKARKVHKVIKDQLVVKDQLVLEDLLVILEQQEVKGHREYKALLDQRVVQVLQVQLDRRGQKVMMVQVFQFHLTLKLVQLTEWTFLWKDKNFLLCR